MQPGVIRHTVAFSLNHATGSAQEKAFRVREVSDFLEIDYTRVAD